MKREPIRELLGTDRLVARSLAVEWGYPRPIHDAELLAGHWFAWGEYGVFWLAPDTELEDGELGVHIAIHPGAALALKGREWSRDLVVLADLLGAARIVARPFDPRLGELLRRIGWTPEGGRWYLSRSGGSGGEIQSEQAQEEGCAEAARQADAAGHD